MAKRKTVDYQWQKHLPWNKGKITLTEHNQIYKNNKGGKKGYEIGKEKLLSPRNNGNHQNKSKERIEKPFIHRAPIVSPRHISKKSKLKKGRTNDNKNMFNNIEYIPKETILDDIRDWRSSKIISNVSNNFATIIMKTTRHKKMNNYQMNIMRGTIALVTSEVLNKVVEKPLSIHDNIKLFIKVGKTIYKVVGFFNQIDELFEFKERDIIKIYSLNGEYKKFLKEYPKIKRAFNNMEDENKVLGKRVHVVIDRPIGFIDPTNGNNYGLNYGFVSDTYTFNGRKQSAYIIDETKPIKEYKGKIVAIIYRKNDVESRWIVSNKNKKYSIEEIQKKMNVQEQLLEVEIKVF